MSDVELVVSKEQTVAGGADVGGREGVRHAYRVVVDWAGEQCAVDWAVVGVNLVQHCVVCECVADVHGIRVAVDETSAAD